MIVEIGRAETSYKLMYKLLQTLTLHHHYNINYLLHVFTKIKVGTAWSATKNILELVKMEFLI